MPSLPPSSWMTTSTWPSRSVLAARAVCARKPGTVGARASRVDDFKKSRRVNTRSLLPHENRQWLNANFLPQLCFRHGEDHCYRSADRFGFRAGARAEGGRKTIAPGSARFRAEQQFCVKSEDRIAVLAVPVSLRQGDGIHRAGPADAH